MQKKQDFWNIKTHSNNAFSQDYYAPIYKQVSKQSFIPLNKFELIARYVESSPQEKETLLTHSHPQYEIYVNCTGDVSFMVKDNIYPVTHGNALLIKPNVFHHCVYNTERTHKHFWILFSFEKSHPLIESLFGKQEILTSFAENDKSKVLAICQKLIQPTLNEFEKYSCFFELLNCFASKDEKLISETFPEDLKTALNYIRENLLENFTISDLAQKCFVSVSTLERRFSSCLNISPMAYIQKQRLFYACSLLKTNKSILEISLKSGFSDYSHFIMLFRKHYGMTPSKYRKKFFVDKER